MSGSSVSATAAIIAAAQACAGGLQAVAEAVRNACADPADAIRLLSALAVFAPAAVVGADAIAMAMTTTQTAVAAACRRAALASLARAAASYQPSCYQDAVDVRTTVSDLLETEAIAAADAGDRDTYHALWALRTAVINDLTTRAADLSRVTTVTTGASLPAAVLAQRLYKDGTRDDQLVAWANPWHPLFMPTSFQAPAS